MNLRQILFAFLCLCLLVISFSVPIHHHHRRKVNKPRNDYDFGLNFLVKYGYLRSPDHLQINEKFTLAVIKFQSVYGLKKTGILDKETVIMMNEPRCGLSDNSVIPFTMSKGGADQPKGNLILTKNRNKRYTLMGKWPSTNISYAFLSFTDDLSIKQQEYEIMQALNVWSRDTPLQFTQSQENADIAISFEQGYHYDGYPFDGPGYTLAHAFFPSQGIKSGNIHFDADEYWTDGSDEDGTSLFKVAVHEIGHSLGLGHSNNKGSVMLPFYQGTTSTDVKLGIDDQIAIHDLYGKNTFSHDFLIQDDPFIYNDPTLTLSTVEIKDPVKEGVTKSAEECEYQFDAAANIRGEVYFFKGNFFWRIERNGKRHFRISMDRFWRNFPKVNIDAVYAISDKIILFSGTRYWSYTDILPDPGFPRNISDFGLPMTDGGIDAAVVWKANGLTYFYKGSKYWKYNEVYQKMEPNYPRDLRPGTPKNMDAALTNPSDNNIYFLKDQKVYKFNNDFLSVIDDVEYIGVKWFGCKEDNIKSVENSPGVKINNTKRESHVLTKPGGGVNHVTHDLMALLFCLFAGHAYLNNVW